MRNVSVSCTLTIYHDGQFWIGLAHVIETKVGRTSGYPGTSRLRACRITFGAEPADEEILQLVCTAWNRLPFSNAAVDAEAPALARNPKRRQREAARDVSETRARRSGMKAQQAIARVYESRKEEARATRREQNRAEEDHRFEQRQLKRKEKHRER